MSITFGGIDPLKLSEGIINTLIQKGVITTADGQAIISAATAKS